MKTYEPWRGPLCPTGRHAEQDPTGPDGEPLSGDEARLSHRFNEACDCPWLVVTSTTPYPHQTAWTRRELDRMIKEMDEGYFDPAHYPRRAGKSMFLPAIQQRILELLDRGDRLGAAQTTLGELRFDQVAWDSYCGCLSLRTTSYSDDGPQHEWLQLWLDGVGEHGQYTARADQPGGDADTIDGVWEERPGLLRAQEDAKTVITASVRGQVRELLAREASPGDASWRDEPLPGMPPEPPAATESEPR